MANNGINTNIANVITALNNKVDIDINNSEILQEIKSTSLAQYQDVGSDTTISVDAFNANETGSNITITNGATGTQWTKLIRLTNEVEVTLDTSWTWQNATVPTIVAGGILVCCWCGSGGIVTFVSPVEQ